MKYEDFEKQAHYDYWICRDIDPRGELVHIRFVENDGRGLSTGDMLKKNGYVQCFSGCKADGYKLPNYRQILVKKDLSSEGPEGTIAATTKRKVFFEDGKEAGVVWDCRHCGIGGLDSSLVPVFYPSGWLKTMYLDEKYVSFYDKLKEIRSGRGYHTKMTYQEVWDIVDGGKAEQILKDEENETEQYKIKVAKYQ